MQLRPHEIAIRILDDAFVYADDEQPCPDPRTAFDGKADALAFLCDLTEEDFGADAAGWRDWFEQCPREMLDLHYDEMVRKAKARRRARGG
jgi:hypothetical protein